LLGRRDCLDHIVRNAQTGHHVVIEHAHAAGRDRTHRQLLVAGNPQLAHEKHVQGCAEDPGHLVRDGYAATREGQDDHIGAISIGHEPVRE
jgi:hypothetical protein